MPLLNANTISRLLEPYLLGATVPDSLYEQLFAYLDVLLKWNARTNLTAIREPEEIIRRHFGESLFTGLKLPKAKTLLDFGSGAGFPGLPIQLLRPDLMVTLAESQNKKASFLREAIRMLGLKTEVWGNRVEAMPESRRFEIVTLRAVDNMEAAVAAALPRGSRHLAILRTSRQVMPDMPGFAPEMVIPIPGSEDQQLLIATRLP